MKKLFDWLGREEVVAWAILILALIATVGLIIFALIHALSHLYG